MKTIATLYELLPEELAAFQSEDGFTLKIDGCPQVILRAPQNAAAAPPEPDLSVSSRIAQPRPPRTHLCKHGCGDSFDTFQASAAHSRYKHPKNKSRDSLSPAQRATGLHGRQSGEFICRPCNNRVFKYQKRFLDHQETAHGVKISSGVAAADSLAASRGAVA